MLEFHDEYINLNEDSHFAFRYNRIDKNGISRGPYTYSTVWPSRICSVSESNPSKNITSSSSCGVFAVRVEDLYVTDNVVLMEFFEQLYPERAKTPYKGESEILLLEYFQSDVVCFSKNEIVLRQCNVIHRFNTKSVGELQNVKEIIENHVGIRKKLPANTFAKDIKDRSFQTKLLSRLFFKDAATIKYAFTMSFYCLAKQMDNIGADVTHFFPLFMAKVEIIRNEYGQIDDSFVFYFVQSFQKSLDLQNHQIMTIVDAILCCLNHLNSEVYEICICKDAHYIANCKMNNRPVERERLVLPSSWHPMILNLNLDEIKEVLEMVRKDL